MIKVSAAIAAIALFVAPTAAGAHNRAFYRLECVGLYCHLVAVPPPAPPTAHSMRQHR